LGEKAMDVDASIETIALALAAQDGRGGGRATAMIGAGFSRNAQARSESNRKFPLWRDIVRPLIDELLPPCGQCPQYGPCPDPKPLGCSLGSRRRTLFEDAAGASGMMTLGDKFEAQKGSARLRAALETAVPDEDYTPGLAHQLLVRLPWADIFTTNWDSLLERAVDTYDRSYDTVVTVEQIASTSAPRIVKLHGCARSGSRLIFTEEDFRTYQKTFAPFVSLVQQSLMENVLVLFGFSGADPNFRAWHGWVRDHLGSNIQPIYLVNLRPTDPIDINLMAGRLINQIDLSQKREWQGASPNETIEAFLSEIHRRLRNLRVNLDWPSSRKVPSEGDPTTRPAINHRDWQLRLEAYPRWLVAPARNRADLLLALDEALTLTFDPEIERGVFRKLLEARDSPAIRTVGEPLTEQESTAIIVAESLRIGLARPGDQLFLHLQSVLAGALNDIFDCVPADSKPLDLNGLRSKFETVLNTRKDPTESARASRLMRMQSRELLLSIDPTVAPKVVLGLLSLIEVVEREARFRDDQATAKLLRDVLWVLAGEGAGRELAVRSALAAALTRLRIEEIANLLQLWPDQPHDAASNLRKAAMLREIGWIRESYSEISNTVSRMRSMGSARRRAVGEASREAWAFYLYADLLESNREILEPIIAPHERNLSLDEVIIELHERLDELETNRCDPRRELDRLSRDLENATIERQLRESSPKRPPAQNSLQQIVADPASTFVILSETVGVSANQMLGINRMALTAARLLAKTNRELAFGLTLRAGIPEDLRFAPKHPSQIPDDLADRETWRITDAVFNKSHHAADLEDLSSILNTLISPSMRSEDLVDPPYLDRKIRLLQHLVAGLLIRDEGQTRERVEKAFVLACRVARSPIVMATRAGWSNQLQLFEALLDKVPGKITGHFALKELLNLPIPVFSDEYILAGWPDPFRLLVTAWQPENAGEPISELRKLGRLLVSSIRRSISNDKPSKSALNEARRALQVATSDAGRQRRLIVARRIALLDAVLSVRAS
jgi:hypothetical protein